MQGDKERSIGLPVSPLMDRTLQGGMTPSQVRNIMAGDEKRRGLTQGFPQVMPSGKILFVCSSLAVCQKFCCHEHCQHNQQKEVSCCPDHCPAMLNYVTVDSAPRFD